MIEALPTPFTIDRRLVHQAQNMVATTTFPFIGTDLRCQTGLNPFAVKGHKIRPFRGFAKHGAKAPPPRAHFVPF
jgi:hypothetical protein